MCCRSLPSLLSIGLEYDRTGRDIGCDLDCGSDSGIRPSSVSGIRRGSEIWTLRAYACKLVN